MLVLYQHQADSLLVDELLCSSDFAGARPAVGYMQT
jgi:hypothetical protein